MRSEEQQQAHEVRVRTARLRTLDEMYRNAAHMTHVAALYYSLDNGKQDQGISGDVLAWRKANTA